MRSRGFVVASGRVATGVALAACGVACSGILGLDSVQYVGPNDASAPTEAASDAPSDAGGELVEIRDAAGHCWDGLPHDFCDDFEGVTTPEARWTGLEKTGTGNVSLFSLPGGQVLRTSTTRAQDGGPATPHDARLSHQRSPWPRTGNGAQARVKVSLALTVHQADVFPHATSVLGVVTGTDAGQEEYVAVFLQDSGANDCEVHALEAYLPAEGGPIQYNNRLLSKRVPKEARVRVVLQVNERQPGLPGGFLVTVDGQSDSFSLTSSSRAAYFRSDVGLGQGSGGGDWSIDFDDVTMDYMPPP